MASPFLIRSLAIKSVSFVIRHDHGQSPVDVTPEKGHHSISCSLLFFLMSGFPRLHFSGGKLVSDHSVG